MKFLTLASLAFMMSCGNPHLSKGGSDPKSVLKPVVPENESCTSREITVSEVQFYFENHDDFLEYVKCRESVTEDFNQTAPGLVQVATNQTRNEFSYTLTHRAEIAHEPGKVVYLEEIFGNEVFDFLVETPVSHAGNVGVDHGVDSTSVNNLSKDALVWSFERPISFFAGRFVGLATGSLASAKLRLFNCAQEQVRVINLPSSPEKVRFIGFISEFKDVCHVSVTASSGQEIIAIDDFTYGEQ